MLTALLLSALLTSAPAAAIDPGPAPAEPVAASQETAAAAAEDLDFATWLAGEEAVPAPELQLAAACLTCAQCPPSRRFCCILASGCAACTARPVVCAPGSLTGAS